MACQSCGLDTTATLCQVCQALAEMAPPPALALCRHCQALIAKPQETGSLCQLCRDLLRSVRSSQWLAFAHSEWERENFLLAQRKQGLL